MESGFCMALMVSSWCIQCFWRSVTAFPQAWLMMVVNCVFHLGFLHFGFAQGKYHGGDLQTMRYDSSSSYACTLFCLNVMNVTILVIPSFSFVCRCRKVMRSSMAPTVLAPSVYNHGHRNHVSKSILATSCPSWVDCVQICFLVRVLCCCFLFHLRA